MSGVTTFRLLITKMRQEKNIASSTLLKEKKEFRLESLTNLFLKELMKQKKKVEIVTYQELSLGILILDSLTKITLCRILTSQTPHLVERQISQVPHSVERQTSLRPNSTER